MSVTVTDPGGDVLVNDVWQSGLTWHAGGFGGLLPGVYKLQFVPQGVSSATISFRFKNDNSRSLLQLTNGTSIATTTIGPYSGDYLKYQITLNAGQTLQLNQPGTGANLTIYNSMGRSLYTRGGSGSFYFTAPAGGNYYIVYWHSDIGGSHSYSTTVSVTAPN
jgi:hypothetical protein